MRLALVIRAPGPLQALIAALLEVGGLSVRHEAVEAETLWAAALRGSPELPAQIDVSIHRLAARVPTQHRVAAPHIRREDPAFIEKIRKRIHTDRTGPAHHGR